MTQTSILAIIAIIPAVIAAICSGLALIKSNENGLKVDAIKLKTNEIHAIVTKSVIPPIPASPQVRNKFVP